MSQPSGKPIYIPPYSGVRLIECRDHFRLVPVPDVRTVYGYGKIKASRATCNPEDPESGQVWPDLAPDSEVWAVMQWFIYKDGHQEPGDITFLNPECDEDRVRASMDKMAQMNEMTREEALSLLKCHVASEEDHEFVENKFPNYQSEPDPKNTDEYDLYHARLKVMSELQPKTVELLKLANATKDPVQREMFWPGCGATLLGRDVCVSSAK
jgi:hypothetical protein